MSTPATIATLKRPKVIIGASGLIGNAVKNACGENVVILSWHEVGAPSLVSRKDLLATYLASRVPHESCDYIIACGLTDPSAGRDRLFYSNFDFPTKLIEATRSSGTARWITFGTIHEKFDDCTQNNVYFQSKKMLSDWMIKAAAQMPGRLTHLRLHTVYGMPLNPRMFLGQIAQALKLNKPFNMSSGEQLREYHHVNDLALAVSGLLDRRSPWDTVLELNSGRPIRLADLAKAVFNAYGKAHLLHIGALTRPPAENLDKILHRTSADLLPVSRDPITGVIEVLREYLDSDTASVP